LLWQHNVKQITYYLLNYSYFNREKNYLKQTENRHKYITKFPNIFFEYQVYGILIKYLNLKNSAHKVYVLRIIEILEDLVKLKNDFPEIS
tara:strand:+ start:162 stop:431 length:270 start_codon:yes stop_codon:yes gene_type:complete